MAKSYTKITNIVDLPVSFNPKTAFPLDARSIFGSFTEAQAAATQAENAGSSNTVYYYGQTLTVFENGIATFYIIQGDNTLREIGASAGGGSGGVPESVLASYAKKSDLAKVATSGQFEDLIIGSDIVFILDAGSADSQLAVLDKTILI